MKLSNLRHLLALEDSKWIISLTFAREFDLFFLRERVIPSIVICSLADTREMISRRFIRFQVEFKWWIMIAFSWKYRHVVVFHFKFSLANNNTCTLLSLNTRECKKTLQVCIRTVVESCEEPKNSLFCYQNYMCSFYRDLRSSIFTRLNFTHIFIDTSTPTPAWRCLSHSTDSACVCKLTRLLEARLSMNVH